MAPSVTMEDLVSAVSADAKSDAEVVATVIHMVNAGMVRLGGKLSGARFDLRALPELDTAASA